MDRWAAEIVGHSISITEEALENESMSLSEALVLAYLFSLKNGAQFSEMKKTVMHLNGHDYDDLLRVLSAVPHEKGKPTCVIANTIKGRGVSFMENKPQWHHRVPLESELAAALAELEKDEP